MERKNDRRVMGVDDVKGMTVLHRETGHKLGEVVDAVVDPTNGRVLGLAVRAEGGGGVLGIASQNLLIGADAVMAAGALENAEETFTNGVLASRDIVGATVVTDAGDLLGRIGTVYLSLEEPRVFYHVAESTLQRFLGRGFYIGGDALRAYSPDGPRMIVPAEADSYAASSLEELLTAHEPRR